MSVDPGALREVRAALVLLDAQQAAEGLRLAKHALSELRERASARERALIDELLARPARRLDREVTPADLLAARRALRAIAEGGPGADRALLGTLATLGALAVAFAIYWALRPPPPIAAEASAVYANAPGYAAAMAIDGDPETSWLLPDGTAGELVLHLTPARRVDRIVLRDTHNGSYDDRATRAYVVEIRRGGEPVEEVSGSFEWADRTTPAELEVGEDDIDEIRVRVETWHRLGGGIAEITLDP